MSNNAKYLSYEGLSHYTDKLKGYFADKEHTHYTINNDFTVNTYDENNEDHGCISITPGNVEIESDIYSSASNSIRLHENIDIDADNIINIAGHTSVNIKGENAVNVSGNAINMSYNDTSQIDRNSYINVTEGNITLLNTNDEDCYVHTESEILNTHDNIVLNLFEEQDTGNVDQYYNSNANISLYKTEGHNPVIEIKTNQITQTELDDDEIEEANISAGITISAGDGQTKIELSADNISIKSNSNAANNKVFTTNGGIATLPDVKNSLPNPWPLTIKANGTTLTNGIYDGSAAKTVNITATSIGAAETIHTHDVMMPADVDAVFSQLGITFQ